MVLAQRVELDVLDQHHLVGVGLEHRVVDHRLQVLGVAAGEEVHRLGDPQRGAQQALPRGVLAQFEQLGAHRGLVLGVVHLVRGDLFHPALEGVPAGLVDGCDLVGHSADLLLGGQAVGDLFQGGTRRGLHPFRGQVGHRDRQVGVPGDVGVGHRLPVDLGDLPVDHHDVQVDGPRGVPVVGADPAQVGFDAAQLAAQRLVGAAGLDQDGGVVERRLPLGPHRRGRIDGTDGQHVEAAVLLQQLDGGRQVVLGFDVAAERHQDPVGGGHRPSRVRWMTTPTDRANRSAPGFSTATSTSAPGRRRPGRCRRSRPPGAPPASARPPRCGR